jgi:hypothetical protein
VLPILDINGSDTSDQILLHDFHLLGAAAYLLPLAFIAGLFGVFAHGMRRHMRFIDLAGLSIAAVAVSRAAYMVVWSLMPVMAPSVEDGPNADALVTVYLSCGSLPLLFVLLGCMRQLRRSWHG